MICLRRKKRGERHSGQGGWDRGLRFCFSSKHLAVKAAELRKTRRPHRAKATVASPGSGLSEPLPGAGNPVVDPQLRAPAAAARDVLGRRLVLPCAEAPRA